MSSAPCKNCEKKGCGSYHDQCEPYQEYKRRTSPVRSEIEDYSKNNGIKKRTYLMKRGYWKVL